MPDTFNFGYNIGNIPNILPTAKFILYADDANIKLTGSNIAEVNQQLKNIQTC